MINIILCGGSGTRLWPISRELMPKQFVKLFNSESLFQKTVKRNSKFCNSMLIVSNQEHYFLANNQLEELNSNTTCTFLLEPVGRNTAPAIALACLSLDKDDIVLVTPSDHLIKDENEYIKCINIAKEYAKDGYLVTFGITPTYPEVGFGYIEAQDSDVKAFHEKPNLELAKEYLKKSNYFWNSGMFCFKAGVFLEELKAHSPEVYKQSLNAYKNSTNERFMSIKRDDMLAIKEDSIDYAVMEKSSKVKVVPSNIDWSDLGSFDALYNELEKDENSNTKYENHICIDSKNNLISGSKRVITTIGVEDLIVVDTDDALLITKKGSSQRVKEIVNKLKTTHQSLLTTHSLVHRPWGTYEVLYSSSNYKIKKIVVKPGKRLSLQKHFHRNEHWIVVSGTATVRVGEKKYLVRPNESTYIKMGEIHRLENEGKIDVVLIEAQVGEYTGEDDILRIEDDYNRENI